MATVEKVEAVEILNSRGNWTVETRLALAGGHQGVAQVPSGGSTGAHEKKNDSGQSRR